MSQPLPTIFLWKSGWHAPRGPYFTASAARTDAEEAARQYPNEVIHVLDSVENVQTPALEPIWETP